MDRLDQLIHSITETEWTLSVTFQFSTYAEKLNVQFKKNDESLVRKCVAAGLIEPWELYATLLDILIRDESLSDEMCDHPALDYTSYFPLNGENPEKALLGGGWISLPTPNGCRLYFAKPSTRRIDYERTLTKINRSGRQLKRMSQDRLESFGNDLQDAKLILAQKVIGIDPYYVAYQATKTKKEYLLPFQYECIQDINIYLNAKTNRIKFVAYFEEDIKDKVFYLRTRGIDEATAIQLVACSQGYFDVDLVGMINDERAANGLELWPEGAKINDDSVCRFSPVGKKRNRKQIFSTL